MEDIERERHLTLSSLIVDIIRFDFWEEVCFTTKSMSRTIPYCLGLMPAFACILVKEVADVPFFTSCVTDQFLFQQDSLGLPCLFAAASASADSTVD